MNVQAPCWASQIPNPRVPLSSGLRAAFDSEPRIPGELRQLLGKLERGLAVR